MTTNDTNKRTSRGGFFAVVAKELKRVFTDSRMVITVVLLPGLLIFVMYSLMGMAFANMMQVDGTEKPLVRVANLPDDFRTLCDKTGFKIVDVNEEEDDSLVITAVSENVEIMGGAESAKDDVARGRIPLLIIFPPDFEESIAGILAGGKPDAVPDVQIYFNSSSLNSFAALESSKALLDAYKNSVFPLFTVNDSSEIFDLAEAEDNSAKKYLSLLLPMLILFLLFSGGMGVAIETIAGEKERGTIATLLVTPLKRWELALGKIVSISIVTLASGASSFIGAMLSLPRMMLVADRVQVGSEAFGLNYGVVDYALMLAVIFVTALLFVGVISITSALAKTVKEASTFMLPLMLLVVFAALSGLIFPGNQNELWAYCIPAYNSVQCLNGIFSSTVEPLQVFVTVVTNIIATGVCVFVLTKMFENERIMFAR
jgi:sodium transport system permease protein